MIFGEKMIVLAPDDKVSGATRGRPSEAPRRISSAGQEAIQNDPTIDEQAKIDSKDAEFHHIRSKNGAEYED